MRYFVTGGSGFLGGHLMGRLKREGHEVLALARSREAAQTVEGLGAQAIQGSLGDISRWEKALAGVDALVHCAAPVDVWGPWKKFYENITVASSQLIMACHWQSVKTFVYISSESVMQDGRPLLDVDESYPCPRTASSFYGQSKSLAEEAILNAEVKVTRVILRPAFIWGKGDNVTPKILDKVRRKQFAWIDSGRALFEAVHVENVAEAICLASQRAKDKAVYLVTDNAAMPTRDFFTALFERFGATVPSVSVPRPIARSLAALIEGSWRVLRLPGQPPLTRFEVDFMSMERRYDISKIRGEIGYQPIVTWQQGLEALTR